MVSMAIKNFRRTTHSLVSRTYYRAHHGWAWDTFQNRSSQTAGERYVEYGFYEKQSYFANLLYRICRKCATPFLVYRVYYGPTMVEP